MGVQEKDPLTQLSLPPGFRFYPTDEELLVQYLCRKVAGHQFSLQIIAEIDLYKFDPWLLPSKALFGEKEWYFFSPRDRKYPNGSRPNRVAGSGYWKATGTDKIITTQGNKVGIKKALVFYIGKAPKGIKTNWIMHEYRLTEHTRKNGSTKLDEWVLCRIYKKSTGSAKTEPSKDHSTGGSSSSSSSHLDDMLESLPEIKNDSTTMPRTVISNSPIQQQLGSGSFDWSLLAGLTHPEAQVSHGGNDVFVPSLPPLSHVESPMEGKFGNYSVVLEDEVQSGLRTQRVNGSNSGYFNHNSSGFSMSHSNPLDPFGMLYPNQPSGFGFGSRQ